MASSASQKHCKLMFRTFDHVGTILQIQLTQNAVKISSQVPLIHYNASEVHKSSAPFKKNQICLLKRKSVHQKLKIETTTMLLAICYPTLRNQVRGEQSCICVPYAAYYYKHMNKGENHA